jgi:hypothetical protein
VVIVLSKLMGMVMMTLCKTEHMWLILIIYRIINTLYLGFNSKEYADDFQLK